MSIENGRLPLVLPGRFKPWAIEVGHGKVLLRGFDGDPEGEERPRVFDVLFQDVSRISLPALHSGLRLTVADPEVTRSEERRVGENWGKARMFLLDPDRNSDYVVAGFVFWAEVLVGGGSPSPLLAEEPAEGSIRGAVHRL
ncbi:hypothetical protein [Streptosporangium sp. NPDC000239]|uniref:Uncharacterized protein n=1 Tax=Streptosporangium jomthongense TaxID=1193683 RepID=A0ABV8F0I0_9ACTN